MNNVYQSNYQQNINKLLNQYLANVAVLTNKLYNYHWNVVGLSFFPFHTKLQEYYEETNEMFDEIAERIKQLEGFPVASLRAYNEMAQIKAVESRNYTDREIIIDLVKDFCYMVAITNQIILYASEANDEATVVLFSDYAVFFEKQLWMLKAHLK